MKKRGLVGWEAKLGYRGERRWYLTCFVAVSLMWWVVDDDDGKRRFGCWSALR